MTAPTFKKLPGVLSLTRRLNITDALFYSELSDGNLIAIDVKRGGLRGTQNINKKATDGRVEVNNIQTTDFAKTDPDAVAVIVKVGAKFFSLKEGLNSCALSAKDDKSLLTEFRQSYFSFIDRVGTPESPSDGLLEVAARYARNLANGRWLWRNRALAATVDITISNGESEFLFDALSIPLNQFGNYSADELALARIIASQLAGGGGEGISIEARLTFGDAMNASAEVYPSQNYLGGDKPKGFARSLYAVGYSDLSTKSDIMELESTRLVGQAALRDTKVANAIRTIDTWYPEFEDYGAPIAVEPTGASLDAQYAFRNKKGSSFEYARKLNEIDVDSDEGKFMIAALVRGGVYSEGGDK